MAEKKDTPFKRAVDWATEESLVLHGGVCGICTWRPWNQGTEEQTKSSLSQHIRRKHRDTILELHEKEQLDLSSMRAPMSASDDDLLAVAGLEDVRQLDRFDLLEIPEDLKKQAEVDGETFIWKRRDEVSSLARQGGQVVKGVGPQQHSTEDGTLKARELVLMKVPFEVVQARREQKDARIDRQLKARAEEVKTAMDNYEKATYDHLRSQRNLDHTTAKQVTRAMMQRRSREGSSGLGISVTDRHGEKEL